MTTFTHTAVGGALGCAGLGSAGSFAAGFVSHFPLDLIPHWDLKSKWMESCLTLGALGLLFALFGPTPVFWGALGGALPDLEHLLPFSRKFYPSHGRLHGKALGPTHALVQAGIVLVCAGLIYRVGLS